MIYNIVTDAFLEQFQNDGTLKKVQNAIREMRKLTTGDIVKVAQNEEVKWCLQKEYIFEENGKEIKIIFVKNGGSLYAAVVRD